MGAAAHIDRLPDWQTHKDTLQSTLSQLPSCAGPVLSLDCTLLFIPLCKAMCSFKKGLCLKTGQGCSYIYMSLSHNFFQFFYFYSLLNLIPACRQLRQNLFEVGRRESCKLEHNVSYNHTITEQCVCEGGQHCTHRSNNVFTCASPTRWLKNKNVLSDSYRRRGRIFFFVRIMQTVHLLQQWGMDHRLALCFSLCSDYALIHSCRWAAYINQRTQSHDVTWQPRGEFR